ncbi:UNVERIFIED_CONTAM: hypothetical protein Slati_2192000 [Sesamum latifolium]|uniref:Reverse transcriptase zinc-binding domain-containing protein n=1 Tax=Sesamum latifolium TaxID=2727402 RepID=A0AAW2WTG0_9LAMI
MNGCFTVSSAYQVARRLRNEAECSDRAQRWDFLWRSKAPPRVITFAWRCAFNALPIGMRLLKRGVRLDDGCSSCGHPDEDVLHVLFRCSLARLVWAISGLAWGTIECSRTSVEEWFREVHQRLSRWEWDYFLTTCWSIWRSRNQLIFEGRRTEAQEICSQARRLVEGISSSLGNDGLFRNLDF